VAKGGSCLLGRGKLDGCLLGRGKNERCWIKA